MFSCATFLLHNFIVPICTQLHFLHLTSDTYVTVWELKISFLEIWQMYYDNFKVVLYILVSQYIEIPKRLIKLLQYRLLLSGNISLTSKR